MMEFDDILKLFNNTIAVVWSCPLLYKDLFERQSETIGLPTKSEEEIKRIIIDIISEKLDVYYPQNKKFIDDSAKQKVFFNFTEKQLIRNLIKKGDKTALTNLLSKKGLSDKKTISDLISFKTISTVEILSLFHLEIESDNKKADIIESIFSSLLYNLYPEKTIHIYNTECLKYEPNFYSYLRGLFPLKYDRTHTLSLLNITFDLYKKFNSYGEFLSSICAFIKEQYKLLQNYCYLGIIVESIEKDNTSVQWKLFSDIVLYAEKHIEESLKIGYFHPEKIKEQTVSYIKNIDVASAKFDICNSGFTYKDCFIITDSNHSLTEREIYSGYKILILFQKNDRDEEVIPCPKCRSNNVRGNSYPIIGVKSWECNNPLCPDKSKYNRGKRYSLSQIIKQEAISDTRNEIDKQTIKDWRLDVVSYKNDNEILLYLIKEYTFCGDKVFVYNLDLDKKEEIEGRLVSYSTFDCKPDPSLLSFYTSCYFKRFMVDNHDEKHKSKNVYEIANHIVYNDDCLHVLSSLKENSIDGAITSPPYYNAKEYSHWNNIYCYLYDMYNHAKYLYKCLKPGSYYLFNIFDYFDNENNVVFSLMGKKRMILGAYIIYIFSRIGFELCQNIIWYKGQIQGNRSTNQSNNSPYYQLPLNCYEHIFCFRKPSEKTAKLTFPHIIHVSPVIKIIKGQNVLGHTAPYPIEIPNLLTSRIKGVVIDPYSGSFTTAKSAELNGIPSISIEQSDEYCKLGMRLLSQSVFHLFH